MGEWGIKAEGRGKEREGGAEEEGGEEEEQKRMRRREGKDDDASVEGSRETGFKGNSSVTSLLGQKRTNLSFLHAGERHFRMVTE